MRLRVPVLVTAMVAATTGACSLVASLGGDYTTELDGSAGDDGSVSDGAAPRDATVESGPGSDGAGPAPDGAGALDGKVTTDAGGFCSAGPGVDLAFANGRVGGLTGNGQVPARFLNQLALDVDGSVVAGVLRTDGSAPGQLVVATFAADGSVAASTPAPLAAQATSGLWAGNGSTFAGLLLGGPDGTSFWLLGADGDGPEVTLDQGLTSITAIAIDAQGAFVAGPGTDNTEGVTHFTLQGEADSKYGSANATAVLAAMDTKLAIAALDTGAILLFSGVASTTKPLHAWALSPTGAATFSQADSGVFTSNVANVFMEVPTAAGDGAFFLTQAIPGDPLVAMRLGADGTPASSFNSGNPLMITVKDLTVQGAVADPSGRLYLLAVETDANGTQNTAAVARLTAAGQADTTFSDGGWAGFTFDAPITVTGGVLTPDGRLMVGVNVTEYDAAVPLSPGLVRFCL